MASLKKSTLRPRKNSNLVATINSPLKTQLASYLTSIFRPGQKLLLAFSGGLDSRVLLELLVDLRSSIGFNLSAMHVHHGLSPNAGDWAKFCSDICAALNVPIEIAHVSVVKDGDLGLEAAARDARYKALLNADADYILLAHHQDDQAETLLLQLLRGAGAKGLSSMAAQDRSKRLLRPLLEVSRAELLAFAEQRSLQWVTDESNDDISHDRNYCRHEIFPILEKRFPAAKQTLARSASHLAEAALLLDDLAQIDLAQGQKQQSQKQLDLTVLTSLPESRARNLLRWWLTINKQPLPSTIRLQEMLRQLLTAKADARVKITVNSAENVYLMRYQGFAYLESNNHNLPIALLWQGEAELRLPDNSRLIFEKKLGCGLAFKRLGINKLRVMHRTGGERFKPDLAKPTRTLKHLLQEANMPPWKREHLPLIYCDDVLAVVPGIGVECTLQARADETGMMILWEQA
jgi:tRNA(Ile)-lysidine synthase